MIYLVLAVLFLHISVLPIVIGAFVEVDSDRRFASLKITLFAVPVFSKRMSFDEIEENVKSKRRLKEQAKSAEKAVDKSPKTLIEFGKRLLTRIRVRHIGICADIGIPDAAVCACTCAAVDIVYAQACAFFGIPYKKQNIKADYNTERIIGSMDGIISVCIADIICAACTSVFCGRGKTRSSHENNDNIARGIQRASD